MIPLPGEPRRLAALYRLVARLVATGIPPLQCATALQDAGAATGARAAAAAFIEAFSTGQLPSRVLAARRAVPADHVAVIAAGESMGRLDAVLDRLARSSDELAKARSLMVRLLIEPFVAWLVIALLIPLKTLILEGAAAYLGVALPILAAPPLLVVLLRAIGARTGAIPGFEKPMRTLAVARAFRAIAMLFGAGLPMPRTLRSAADAAAHPQVTPALQAAARDVEGGATLTDALRRTGRMRPVEMALVADGELTGRVDVAFERGAELLEHEGFSAMRLRMRAVGVVLFVLVAAYAAFSLLGAVLTSVRTDVGA